MEIANQIDYAEEANSRLGEGATTRSQQAIVNAHFESSALQWERIYGAATLGGRIYQARMAIALQWIEQLHLPPTARLLEIGCGAGFATAALAMRGYHIDAVDSVPAMLNLTSKRLAQTGAAERVRIMRADVRHLPTPDHSFDLVFALGVLPWQHPKREQDRKSTRLNSSHVAISYAVHGLKKRTMSIAVANPEAIDASSLA